MNLDIDGRTALVTGASSGIGRGIALALAAEGVRTIVTARREDRLRELAKEITDAGGPEPVVMQQDFLHDDAPQLIADRAGHVEILVDNAGGSRPFGRDATEAQWEEALTLNFTRHRCWPAAGAAMHAWAKGLSREVGRYGITENSIPPAPPPPCGGISSYQ